MSNQVIDALTDPASQTPAPTPPAAPTPLVVGDKSYTPEQAVAELVRLQGEVSKVAEQARAGVSLATALTADESTDEDIQNFRLLLASAGKQPQEIDALVQRVLGSTATETPPAKGVGENPQMSDTYETRFTEQQQTIESLKRQIQVLASMDRQSLDERVQTTVSGRLQKDAAFKQSIDLLRGAGNNTEADNFERLIRDQLTSAAKTALAQEYNSSGGSKLTFDSITKAVDEAATKYSGLYAPLVARVPNPGKAGFTAADFNAAIPEVPKDLKPMGSAKNTTEASQAFRFEAMKDILGALATSSGSTKA